MDANKYYFTVARLQAKDFENGTLKMTIGDAEFLYEEFKMITTYKNGKIKIEMEK